MASANRYALPAMRNKRPVAAGRLENESGGLGKDHRGNRAEHASETDDRATACFGNMSETSVNRFAAQPWCAEAARPIRQVASQRLDALAANTTGTTHSAQMSIAVLRLALTDQPRFKR